MDLYFSDVFEVEPALLEAHGAFNISLVTDLPLFIDPFLLFDSKNPEYRELHDRIIDYLRFLRKRSEAGGITEGLISAWYRFGEVKQTWLGFSAIGNQGRGLGPQFARALNQNLVHVFRNFGNETVTKGTHLEKLCLINAGVGRDMISDFATNLIKDFLLGFTSDFATKHIDRKSLRDIAVPKVRFSFESERWMPATFTLPIHNDDFVLLCPKDILTKDDTWINHRDMISNFDEIPDAVSNEQLRAEINNYFYSRLPKDKEATKEEYENAVHATFQMFPQLIDFYIRVKEDSGEEAARVSARKVQDSDLVYVKQFGSLARLLEQESFYKLRDNTEDEAAAKIAFFKDIIEKKDGYKLFYDRDGIPIRLERDVHIMFRLVWHGTPSDVSREVNDGRGPADYKIARGAADKTIIEFKLASNSQLKRNLESQVEIYKAASDAKTGFKVILFFSDSELLKVQKILADLGLDGERRIVLIDARKDNKPSGSRA